ncbi:MAG: L-histidine N(alpha)-methyltransferase [Ignavibacteriaceae bacterium]
MVTKAEETVQEEILSEVEEGLSLNPKRLPSKLFYDAKGSVLFDDICNLDEYYPTRTELKIMENNIEEMSSLLGEGTLLIELGSGSSIKIRLLLDNIPGLAGYVPVDISSLHLIQSSNELKGLYPHIDIFPLAADYTKDFELPEIDKSYDHKAVYYPGSTIGNFTPSNAKKFLERIAKICGLNGGFIIGVDLRKDKKILEAAYNDKNGVTAAFNLNILEHLNNEFNSDFDLNKFEHLAFFNDEESRIEMHLISKESQKVHLNGSTINFQKDESILTEYSYKYTLESFAGLVSDNFEVRKVWIDKNHLFSIQYLRVKN